MDHNVSSMFRGNLIHQGKYASESIIQQPTLRWKFKTGGVVNSSAALDDENLYFGRSDSNFYCINQNTGELKWKFKTGGGIYSSPALNLTM